MSAVRTVTAKAWVDANPARVEDAAALFGVADPVVPPGWELVGWTWEWPHGRATVYALRTSVKHHASPPVRMRPVFAPVPVT